jgi:chitodextrinase
VIASDPSKITFAARVPSDIPYPEEWLQKFTHSGEVEHYGSWSTVPVADFRVISSGTGANNTDYVLQVGITSVAHALALAAIFLFFVWGLLHYFSTLWGLPGAGLMLKIISTQAGFASVSQFQIILWTFVVGAGAIYVMALSGNLIEISSGTLVLLGITGIAALGSKLRGGQDTQPAAGDSSPTPTAPDPIATIDTQASQSEVKLSWRPPTTGGPPAAYTVQYRVTSTPVNSWMTATSRLTRPSFTVVGLTPGTPYDFQVYASNLGGSGSPAAVNLTTATAVAIPVGAPGPVPNLGATGSPTASTLNLIWGQPSGAPASYLIEYRIHDSDEFWQSARSATASAAFTVTRLLPYTLYDFRVTPINSAGSGPPSSMISASTGPRTPLWSDLVMPNDRKREIDVTRVQMLFFTLITATFVAVKILVSSEIPDIPQGFLLLMGISNGVYLTAKFIPD